MSFRSEWDDIKRAFWGVVMLPWVVVRDLGKMAWEAVVRKRDYADRRHEMLDDTMARPIDSALEKAGVPPAPHKPVVKISASHGAFFRGPRGVADRTVEEDTLKKWRKSIRERIERKFPTAKIRNLGGDATDYNEMHGECDICGRKAVGLLVFTANFAHEGRPFQLEQRMMCKDFAACDDRRTAREHEAAS